MKFIRYQNGKPEYRGVLDGENITMISGSIFHDFALTDEKIKLEGVKILPPVLPSKIIGLRKNYEENKKAPLLFLKPPSSVIPTESSIVIPTTLDRVMAEGELAVIIGKKCRNVKEEHAAHFILGYSIANDVTGISERFEDSYTSSKSFDTFTPLGPIIQTECNIANLEIKTFINGELKQSGSTDAMFFKIPYLISYISSIMTLEAGDVILTGTPSPSVEIKPGDKIEITIGNIGALFNTVISNE